VADENTESYAESVKELDFSNKYAGLAANFANSKRQDLTPKARRHA
jgi:hypothetical protein